MYVFGHIDNSFHVHLGLRMITINILCVGSLKEKYWQDAVAEYKKRISAFAKINVVEVKESDYGSSQKDILFAKEQEAKRLEPHKKGHCIALEVDGKSFDSEGFAEHIKQLVNSGVSCITFCIGGSFGLDKKFSDSADQKMSFSKFTFPHQMMRIILLEQIYRAFTILNNKTYHK